MTDLLADRLTDGGRVIGIDPGAHTGLVCVALDRSLDWNRARWVGSAKLSPSNSRKLTPPARDHDLSVRIAEQLEVWARVAPTHIALEEPLDATRRWTDHRTGRPAGEVGRRTEVDFRLGAYYGLAVVAAGMSSAGWLASYPVQRFGARPGWMQGTTRERVLAIVQQTMRVIGAPVDGISEHEMMALGVAMYHVSQVHEARMAAKIAAVRAHA